MLAVALHFDFECSKCLPEGGSSEERHFCSRLSWYARFRCSSPWSPHLVALLLVDVSNVHFCDCHRRMDCYGAGTQFWVWFPRLVGRIRELLLLSKVVIDQSKIVQTYLQYWSHVTYFSKVASGCKPLFIHLQSYVDIPDIVLGFGTFRIIQSKAFFFNVQCYAEVKKPMFIVALRMPAKQDSDVLICRGSTHIYTAPYLPKLSGADADSFQSSQSFCSILSWSLLLRACIWHVA